MSPDKRLQVIAAVNGPGEMSGFLHPLAHALKRREPSVKIIAALMPCRFATGAEASVAESMDEVDEVWPPRQTLRAILSGMPANGSRGNVPGALIYLGGDPFLTRLLARRLGYPSYAYLEKRISHQGGYDRIFLASERPLDNRKGAWSGAGGGASWNGSKNGAINGKYSVVGNLMVDAVRLRFPPRDRPSNAPPTLAIMPGSRGYMVHYMLPLYIKVASLLRKDHPDLRCLIAKADYVSLDKIKRCADTQGGWPMDWESARWQPGGRYGSLAAAGGARLEIMDAGEAIAQADLALTLPGTNTAELSTMGVPMIVSLPTYWAEIHPLPGVLGVVDRIPLFGNIIKRGLARSYLRNLNYIAYPNICCRRELVPEIIGPITAEQIARKASELLGAPCEDIGRQLREIMGPPGAAERVAEQILASA